MVARIRPLLKQELDKDIIVSAASTSSEPTSSPNTVRIPNPKNEVEAYSFQFNSVYDQEATQQQIFENEGKEQYVGDNGAFLTLQQSHQL